MSRKPVSDEVQNAVLLKSRRRCCLCFWLKGIDEVQKGQIAHLDQKNDNPAEENLAFLCFDHHDEYDGQTRQSKGLREDEVKRWRDELYKEMECRFRTFRKRAVELSLLGIRWLSVGDYVTLKLKLKNVGEVEIKHPIVSLRLLDEMMAEVLTPSQTRMIGGMEYAVPELPNMWGMAESTEDFFEPSGKVGMIELGSRFNPVLPADHSLVFEALSFPLSKYLLGSKVDIEFRVDGEAIPPFKGTIEVTIPTDQDGFLFE